MERLLANLKIPFYIVIALAIIYILMNISSAFNSYWNGRLTRLQYKKLLYDFDKEAGGVMESEKTFI